MPHWDEYNPWKEKIVYVPIEELASVVAGGTISTTDGTIVGLTEELLLEMWNRAGYELDAYLLPGPPFGFSAGIRYGSHGAEYLSPPVRDKVRAQELVDLYGEKSDNVVPFK